MYDTTWAHDDIFDTIVFVAGSGPSGFETLAIDEFNASNPFVRIDRWRGIDKQRPFPGASWLRRMYIVHDIEAISMARSNGERKVIGIDDDTGCTG
jgi:hypothetical protein